MLQKQEKIRDWNKLVKQYISQHKYLREVGKMWINKDGTKNNEVQAKIKEALVETDKILFQLKLFFVPFLDTTNLFKEDELKSELESLVEQNSVLMGKNNSLMVQNDDLEVQIQNLKSCGSENEISADEILLLKQHQKQCEDLLITQNNLIENLKEDLEQRKKELQSLRQLNNNLQIELSKEHEASIEDK